MGRALFLLFFFSCNTLASNATLKDKYIELRDSVLPSSFEFKCGDLIYLLKKPIFGSSALYVKEGIEWSLLEDDIILKPAGFKTISSIESSTIDLNSIDLSAVDLPIFNHKDIITKTTKKNYLSLSNMDFFGSILVMFTFDFYDSRLEATNVEKLKGKLILDEKKYLREQKSKIIMNSEQERLIYNERLRLLRHAIEKNQFPIEYEVEREAIKQSEYCYVGSLFG